MLLFQELQDAGHSMNLLIENYPHLLVTLHLKAIDIANHIHYITCVRKSILFNAGLVFCPLYLHSCKQQFLLIAEDLIHRTLRHTKSTRNLIHLHRLHAALVKLSHGISYDFIAQFLSILINFCHISYFNGLSYIRFCQLHIAKPHPLNNFCAKIQKKIKFHLFLISFLLPLHNL